MRSGVLAAARLAAALALLGAVSACTPEPPPVPRPTTAPTADRPAATTGDLDGDGEPDLVVGGTGSPASVQVRYATGRVQSIVRADLDGTDAASRFGASVLVRDLDADGFADLVVGDRGDDASGQALFLVPGSADGLRPAGAHRYDAPPRVGRFGSALALLESPRRALVVGAPGEVEDGYVGGAIVVYPLGADGLPAFDVRVVTQGTAGVPGKAERGDWFGASLASDGRLLLVGAPLENAGPVPEAGAVNVLTWDGTGFRGTGLTKRTPGVPGTATSGDLFGASVGIGDGYAVVGIPGQDHGRRTDAGAVQPFRVEGDTLVPLAPITQDSRGLPGANEAGDAFGTAVAVVRPCPGVVGALVGAPGEDIQKASRAGAAWVVPFTAATGCPARKLYGGHALGTAEKTGKRIGSAVAALRGTDAGAADTLVVAAPGDAGSGGGTVYVLAPGADAAEEPFTGLPTPFGISLAAVG